MGFSIHLPPPTRSMAAAVGVAATVAVAASSVLAPPAVTPLTAVTPVVSAPRPAAPQRTATRSTTRGSTAQAVRVSSAVPASDPVATAPRRATDLPGVLAEDPTRPAAAPLTSSSNPFDKAHLQDRAYARLRDVNGTSVPGRIGAQLGVIVGVILEAALFPAPSCDDATFLRRLTLDALGRPPRPEELSAFLSEAAPDKRERAVERVLADPELARHWGLDVLAPRLVAPRGSDLEKACVEALERDEPLSGLVRDLILGDYGGGARGTAFEDIYAWAQLKGDRLMESLAGQPTKCARCHDAQDYHGITDPERDDPNWTRKQNYSLYAVFAERSYEADFGAGPIQPGYVVDGVAGPNKKALDASLPALPNRLAQQWRKKADYPKRAFLEESEQIYPYESSKARREAFAERFVRGRSFLRGTGHWIFAAVMGPLTDPNRMFSKTLDRCLTPNLLRACADVFAAERTSLRGFLRTLFTSRLYQFPDRADAAYLKNAAELHKDATRCRSLLRRLPAETLWRALADLGQDYRPAGKLDPDFFLLSFGAPLQRRLITERSDDVNAAQALMLMNGPLTQLDTAPLAARVAAGELSRSGAVIALFRRVLGRAPRAAELSALERERTRAAPTPSDAEWLEDVAHVLAGSHEYLLR